MVVESIGCSASTPFFEIKSAFKLVTTNVAATHPSCGSATGKITGLQLINNENEPLTTVWKDGSGNIKGNNLTLENVPAGIYKLYIETADKSCAQIYGPVSLMNTTGPTLNEEFVFFKPASCTQSDGVIYQVVASGTAPLKFSWKNEAGVEVSTDQLLSGQPAGKYILQFTDGSSCGPVYSSPLEIPQANGIDINYTEQTVKPAACNVNGSITGITVTGATKYEWKNEVDDVVSHTVDFTNAPPGNYTLTASNNFNCSKTTPLIPVGNVAGTVYPDYPVQIINACGGQTNGSITIQTDGLPQHFRWVDEAGELRGDTFTAPLLGPGNYRLFLTDAARCETQYGGIYTVLNADPLQLTAGSAVITNDQCDMKVGSITGVTVTGGTSPYTYSWADAMGNVVSPLADLFNAGEGAYTLTVRDIGGCSPLVPPIFNIANQYRTVDPPRLDNVELCSPGEAIIQVTSPQAGEKYRVYADNNTATAIAENTTGRFSVPVKANTSFFVSLFSGSCESPRSEVKVSVGLSNLIIANTITPNGDGLNDFWVLKDIEQYPTCNVQVFNRAGQKVFESNGYSAPFNGTYGGQNLPMGTYYYIIRLNSTCKLISGSLNIIR